MRVSEVCIVILACHVSSENLCHLHGTTTPFSIVCHAYFARTATVRADYCAFFQPISTTVLGGGWTSVKNHFFKMKGMANYGKHKSCIPHPYIFVQLLQDSEAWFVNPPQLHLVHLPLQQSQQTFPHCCGHVGSLVSLC